MSSTYQGEFSGLLKCDKRVDGTNRKAWAEI